MWQVPNGFMRVDSARRQANPVGFCRARRALMRTALFAAATSTCNPRYLPFPHLPSTTSSRGWGVVFSILLFSQFHLYLPHFSFLYPSQLPFMPHPEVCPIPLRED